MIGKMTKPLKMNFINILCYLKGSLYEFPFFQIFKSLIVITIKKIINAIIILVN